MAQHDCGQIVVVLVGKGGGGDGGGETGGEGEGLFAIQ